MTAPRLGWWWVVAPVLLAGLALVALGHVRAGGYVAAASLLLAALVRLVLPTAASGGLAVRSRGADVVVMLALGVALAVITWAVDLTPQR